VRKREFLKITAQKKRKNIFKEQQANF